MPLPTFAALSAVSAASHTVETTNLWLAWTLDPTLLISLALILGGYLYLSGPGRRRWRLAERADRTQVMWFIIGWVVLALALVSPLDHLGDEYLFSAHMVQHMLIAVVAPPLLLLGVPGWMVDPLLRRPGVLRVARWAANPIVAFGVFQGDMWLWHAPALYDLTLTNDTVHIVEHTTFLLFGLLFWLPILSPTPLIPRISRGFAVLYLFIGCQPMVALGALLTFAATPLYAPYVSAPRIWGLSPLTDQQLGGLIMWLPTNIPYLIGLSANFFLWVSEHDRAERLAAGEYDAEDAAGAQTALESPVESEPAAGAPPQTDGPSAPLAPQISQAMIE